MTPQEIQKFGEIQYLKGRLDELTKAALTITNMERARKIDQRIEKYLNKLKAIDEISFHLYDVELSNRHRSKEKSKKEIKEIFEKVLESSGMLTPELKELIETKLKSY